MAVGLVHCKEVEKKSKASQSNVEPIINKEDDDRNLKEGAQLLKTCTHQLDLAEQPLKHHCKLVPLNRWVLQDFTTRSLTQTSQLKLGTGRLDVLVMALVYKPFRWSQRGAVRRNGSAVVVHAQLAIVKSVAGRHHMPERQVLIGDVTALPNPEWCPPFISETLYSDQHDVTCHLGSFFTHFGFEIKTLFTIWDSLGVPSLDQCSNADNQV